MNRPELDYLRRLVHDEWEDYDPDDEDRLEDWQRTALVTRYLQMEDLISE